MPRTVTETFDNNISRAQTITFEGGIVSLAEPGLVGRELQNAVSGGFIVFRILLSGQSRVSAKSASV